MAKKEEVVLEESRYVHACMVHPCRKMEELGRDADSSCVAEPEPTRAWARASWAMGNKSDLLIPVLHFSNRVIPPNFSSDITAIFIN